MTDYQTISDAQRMKEIIKRFMFPTTHTYPNLYCEDCGEPLYEPFYSTGNGDFVCETCAENYDEADLTLTTYDDVEYDIASHIRNLDDIRDDI